MPLNVEIDTYGNLYKVIGESNILWSCHTDTVHKKEGRQKITVKDSYVELAPTERTSNCLGADCTTGVFIMTEMIKANIPGLYVFHREEECGGGGSTFFSTVHTDLLKNINIAIAFDRRGTTSVITHQFERCCSNTFATSLANQLPGFKLDDTGVFTDTANYTRVVSECTNVSVGYHQEHTIGECQDLNHLQELISLMISLDPTKLVIERDPSVVGDYGRNSWGHGAVYGGYDDDYYYGYQNRRSYNTSRYSNKYGTYYTKGNKSALAAIEEPEDFYTRQEKRDELEDLIIANPKAVAYLLEQYGISSSDLEEYIYAA